jgi:hypothetical protein
MAADSNWPRWIFASLTSWFDSQRAGVDMFIEGDDHDTADLADYFEFRMNGPHMREWSKDFWEFQVTVNILVVHKLDAVSIHTFHANIGKMTAAFVNGITMFRYGTGGGDDQQSFGCMQLMTTKADAVQVDHLGQMKPEIKEMQAMVQGTYCMYLEV